MASSPPGPVASSPLGPVAFKRILKRLYEFKVFTFFVRFAPFNPFKTSLKLVPGVLLQVVLVALEVLMELI